MQKGLNILSKYSRNPFKESNRDPRDPLKENDRDTGYPLKENKNWPQTAL